jgi:hypothetical protein
MTISGRIWRPAGVAAAVLIAATAPSLAWDQGGAMNSLPSGGLMLKEVPGTDAKIQNLPGVRLNPQLGNSASGNCTQQQVTSFQHGVGSQSGTLNKCQFGNFSISTFNSRGSGGGTGYNPFPVPGPLQQAGPPPGSDGFAPRQPSMFGPGPFN